MIKVKLVDAILNSSCLGQLILRIRGIGNRLTSLEKRLQDCYISSLESRGYLIDPFQATDVLNSVKSDSLISELIGQQKFEEVNSFLQSECANVKSSFESRLRQFCLREQISIVGQFPSFILADFLKLQVSEEKSICNIGSVIKKTLLIEAIAPAILDVINIESGRTFNAPSFLEELYSAYKRVVLLNSLNLGDSASVKDVFFELVMIKQSQKYKKSPLKVNYQDYTLEFFKYDLVKLIRDSLFINKEARRLELLPTAFSTEALPLLINSEIRYIGRIAFTGGMQ